MGLIRKAMVVGGILFALPSMPAPQGTDGQASLQSSTFAAITAAADAVADFKGFCERRPQACITGQYLVTALENKARFGAHLIFEWSNPQPPRDQQQTASITSLPKPDSKAKPPLRLVVDGGVPGDVATPAILVNSLPRLVECRPGLHTMRTLGLPHATV